MACLTRITILGAKAIALTKDGCRRLVSAERAGAHLLVVHVDETDRLAMTRAHLQARGSFDAIPEDLINGVSGQVWGWSEESVQENHAQGLNINLEGRLLRLALSLAQELIGAPRHLSHVRAASF
jgi:hypothetical protein